MLPSRTRASWWSRVIAVRLTSAAITSNSVLGGIAPSPDRYRFRRSSVQSSALPSALAWAALTLTRARVLAPGGTSLSMSSYGPAAAAGGHGPPASTISARTTGTIREIGIPRDVGTGEGDYIPPAPTSPTPPPAHARVRRRPRRGAGARR